MSSRRKGFTLIEMIIVISILGILMALILPKVASVKGLGQKMQCASNMKTILQSCALYVTDASMSPTKTNATTPRANPNEVFGALFSTYDENSRKWALTDMKVFACPLDSTLTNPNGLRPSAWGKALTISATASDGFPNPSYTIAADSNGAMPDFQTEPDGNVFLIETSLNRHTGANFGFYNGSVKFYSAATTADTDKFPKNINVTNGEELEESIFNAYTKGEVNIKPNSGVATHQA